MLVDEGVRELDRTFDRDRDRNSRRAGDGDRTRVREKDNGSRQQLPVRNVTRASPSQSTSTTSSLPPARRRGTARQDYSSESTGRAEGDEYQHASEGHGSYRSQRRDSVRTRSYDSDVVRRTPPDARRTLSGQLEQLKGRVKHSSASTHKTRPRQAAAAVYSGGEYDDNRTHPRPGHARDRRVVVTAAGHAEDAPRDALDAADDESATDTSSRRARHQASRCNRLSIETATTLTPTPTPQPPTPQWPPAPLRKAGRKWLTGKEAYHFICAGAAQFDGSTEALAHAPDGQARFFASPCQYSREPIPKAADDEIGQGADPKDGLTDAAPWQASAFAAASMPRSGFDQDRDWPWLALEQPSMETCFGVNPGTTTLNYFVGKAGCLTPPLRYAGDVKPRPVTMMEVFERIRALKNGLESDVSLPVAPLTRYLGVSASLLPGMDFASPYGVPSLNLLYLSNHTLRPTYTLRPTFSSAETGDRIQNCCIMGCIRSSWTTHTPPHHPTLPWSCKYQTSLQC